MTAAERRRSGLLGFVTEPLVDLEIFDDPPPVAAAADGQISLGGAPAPTAPATATGSLTLGGTATAAAPAAGAAQGSISLGGRPAGSAPTSGAITLPPSGWESYTPLDVSAGGIFTVADGTNVKVVGQTANAPVMIRSNNRVVIMGLTINVNVSNWTTIGESGSEGLEMQHRTVAPTTPAADSLFHIEGVRITGTTLSQGIRTSCPGADVQIVNCHVDPIGFDSCDQRDGTNGKSTNHPDLLQTYGAQKSLIIDGFTGYSAYQGLFFKEDNTIVGGPISLRRVDVHAVRRIGSDGVSYYGHRMLWNYRDQPITTDGDTVWVQGHLRNGWQSGGFYRERYYDALTVGDTVYRPANQRASWDDSIEGWTGALGTIAWDDSDPYEGTGNITLTKAFAATGYDSVRTYDPGAVSRNLSASGEVFACWVKIPAGTPGTSWKARLGGYKFTGNVLVEQTIADGTALVPGQWTLCTWTVTDPALTGDLRRFHVRVGADNVNATVTVAIDNYTQGSFTTSDGYVLEPAPSGGVDADAVTRGPSSAPTVSSDGLGSYATMTALTGKIRLGAPVTGEYVPAGSVGSGYVSTIPTTTATGSITLGGAATPVAAATTTGGVTLGGTVAGQARPSADGTVTLGGAATASAPAAATGSLTLGGAPTARAGATTGGTVTLGGTAAGTQPGVSATGTVTLSGAAALSVLAVAAGTLTLTGTSTGRAPATTLGSVVLGGSPTVAVRATTGGQIVLDATATGTDPSLVTVGQMYVPDVTGATLRPLPVVGVQIRPRVVRVPAMAARELVGATMRGD